MSEVQNHYDRLLATHYAWMTGLSLTEKVAEQQALLRDLGLDVRPQGLAIDLGCGPGYQSFALIALGFDRVLALDTSRALLDALEAARDVQQIATVLGDLRRFTAHVEPASADVIVCMGDTLTHLADRSDVSGLFRDAHAALRGGGRLILTFRDLSTELAGLERFLPVRADDQRIMVCVLDYEADYVSVTDLVHVRGADGWTLHKSCYRKLRLRPSAIASELTEIGFVVDEDRPAGRMHAIVARKP